MMISMNRQKTNPMVNKTAILGEEVAEPRTGELANRMQVKKSQRFPTRTAQVDESDGGRVVESNRSSADCRWRKSLAIDAQIDFFPRTNLEVCSRAQGRGGNLAGTCEQLGVVFIFICCAAMQNVGFG